MVNRLELSGHVLGEFSDWDSPLGLVYCRGGAGFAASFFCSRPVLVFARCHSLFDFSIDGGRPARVDSSSVHVLPAAVPGELSAVTGLSHFALFCPSKELLREASARDGLPLKELSSLFGRPGRIARNNWLNEIMHRFVFERVELGGNSNAATAFLSAEIIKETFFLAKTKASAHTVFNLDDTGFYDNQPVMKRALSHIEANLFSGLTMPELARNSFASESTLLRLFRKEFALSPFEYIAGRRLEESLSLLRNRRYGVGEVAGLVGYGSASSFIAAFRKKFGLTPLEWRAGHARAEG